jgi:Glycosyl hydrolases family 2, sugar binding domain
VQAQGFGDDVTVNTRWIGHIADRDWFSHPRYAEYREPGNIKVPFWLQPEKHYRGSVWIQREIVIPEDWRGRRVTLFLERPHWETRVWLGDRYIGSDNSLAAPHVYDFGRDLAPGTHVLTLCVNNEVIIGVGANAHSVSEHTQSNWNGIVGRIELRAGSPAWVDDVQVYPDCRAARDPGAGAAEQRTLARGWRFV